MGVITSVCLRNSFVYETHLHDRWRHQWSPWGMFPEDCSLWTDAAEQRKTKERLIMIGKTRRLLDTLLGVTTRTHCFIQLSGGRAGNLLHVVCRKPQLFLSSVVTTPPKDHAQVHDKLPYVWRRPCDGADSQEEVHSPAALLLIHIEDERLFGEAELVLPLSPIVVQSFDCTLKHTAARKYHQPATVYITNDHWGAQHSTDEWFPWPHASITIIFFSLYCCLPSFFSFSLFPHLS